MNFFRLNSRQDYASYSINGAASAIVEPKIDQEFRIVASELSEYLGSPPRKPGKQGDIHITASSYFVRTRALDLFEASANGRLLSRIVKVVGRESEEFCQVWVTNFVDCLALRETVVSPAASPQPGRIGIIKRPVFDESRWDGSDLFVVPQDARYCYFVTERFVDRWREAKLKGAMFSRFLMDPNAIKC